MSEFAVNLEEVLEKHTQGIYELKVLHENQPLSATKTRIFQTFPLYH